MMEAQNVLNVFTGPNRRQLGVSLIEVLIGVTVGLIILAGALALFASALKSSKTNLAMINLDQELRAVMEIMTRNMRQAGYYAKAPGNGSDLPQYGPSNPFQTAGYEMRLADNPKGNTCDGNGVCECITFSYDIVDPSPPASSCTSSPPSTCCPGRDCGSREYFAFRLNKTTTPHAIEMRKSSSGPPICGGAATDWEAITDDTVEVTGLTFQYESRDATTPTRPLALNLYYTEHNVPKDPTDPNVCTCGSDPCPCGCPYDTSDTSVIEDCLQMRTVIVTINAHRRCRATDPSGKCKNDDEKTTMSLRERVKIANDRYCTEPDGTGPGNPPC